MEIQTRALGAVNIDERQIIELPEGLYGFESYRRYALIDAPQKPFVWLQSLDDCKLAFLLINPFFFRPDYELDIDDNDLQKIGISDPRDAIIFSIVTIHENGGVTANLQGPLVINRKNNQGAQAVLADPRWKTCHDIAAEAEREK